jgi:hypothetical protein
MGGGGGRDTGVGEGGLPWLVGWLVVVDVMGECLWICVYISTLPLQPSSVRRSRSSDFYRSPLVRPFLSSSRL